MLLAPAFLQLQFLRTLKKCTVKIKGMRTQTFNAAWGTIRWQRVFFNSALEQSDIQRKQKWKQTNSPHSITYTSEHKGMRKCECRRNEPCYIRSLQLSDSACIMARRTQGIFLLFQQVLHIFFSKRHTLEHLLWRPCSFSLISIYCVIDESELWFLVRQPRQLKLEQDTAQMIGIQGFNKQLSGTGW